VSAKLLVSSDRSTHIVGLGWDGKARSLLILLQLGGSGLRGGGSDCANQRTIELSQVYKRNERLER